MLNDREIGVELLTISRRDALVKFAAIIKMGLPTTFRTGSPEATKKVLRLGVLKSECHS